MTRCLYRESWELQTALSTTKQCHRFKRSNAGRTMTELKREKISVIIPTLNESEGIAESVRRAWEAGADELLVVDGGSTDDTADIAAGLNCQVLRSAAGRALQQNVGAEAATGEMLLFLHADNWLPADAIDQIRARLAAPSKKFLHGAFRQQIEAEGIAFRALEWGNARRVQILGLPFGDQGIFVPRSLFFEVGKFPAVRLMEDLLLSKQLRRRAWPELLPGPLHVNARRWKKHGIVRQTLRNWSLLSAHTAGVSPDRLARYY